MVSETGRIIGVNGSNFIGTSAQTEKNYYALIMQEDTVISVLTGEDDKGNAVDFKTVQGLSSKTLKQGTLICVPQGCKITAITLASGSAIGY